MKDRGGCIVNGCKVMKAELLLLDIDYLCKSIGVVYYIYALCQVWQALSAEVVYLL